MGVYEVVYIPDERDSIPDEMDSIPDEIDSLPDETGGETARNGVMTWTRGRPGTCAWPVGGDGPTGEDPPWAYMTGCMESTGCSSTGSATTSSSSRGRFWSTSLEHCRSYSMTVITAKQDHITVKMITTKMLLLSVVCAVGSWGAQAHPGSPGGV